MSNAEKANIQKLQNAVMEKDETGSICMLFANDVKGANRQLLEKTYENIRKKQNDAKKF